MLVTIAVLPKHPNVLTHLRTQIQIGLIFCYKIGCPHYRGGTIHCTLWYTDPRTRHGSCIFHYQHQTLIEKEPLYLAFRSSDLIQNIGERKYFISHFAVHNKCLFVLFYFFLEVKISHYRHHVLYPPFIIVNVDK